MLKPGMGAGLSGVFLYLLSIASGTKLKCMFGRKKISHGMKKVAGFPRF
jgi:hypothetical protein